MDGDSQTIIRHWFDLLDARHRGTRRPWHETRITDEQMAERDREAREDRYNPFLPIGYSGAPGHVDVMDAIREVQLIVYRVEDGLRELRGFTRLCSRCRAEADAHPTGFCPGYRLDTAHNPRSPGMVSALTWIATATPADAADQVAEAIHVAANLVRRALNLHEPSMTIKAPCPHCRGTLRAYLGDDARVQCMDPDCPAPAERERGRPTWRFSEWADLAAALDMSTSGR